MPPPLLRVYFDLVFVVFLVRKVYVCVCVCVCVCAQWLRRVRIFVTDLGIESVSPVFPALQMTSLPAKP